MQKIDEQKIFYTEMVDRIAKHAHTHTSTSAFQFRFSNNFIESVESSQQLAQCIRDHGSRSLAAVEDPVFGKCMMQAGEVLRFAEVLRTQMVFSLTIKSRIYNIIHSRCPCGQIQSFLE